MKPLSFWTPVIVSLIVTPLALLLGIASGGVGHGDYFWAMILFPYTMLSIFPFQSITAPFILLAIIQFPLYGIILAFAAERKRFLLLTAALAVAHVLAAALCLFLSGKSF